MKKNLGLFHAEVTDTYGGDANYCWVRRYSIRAKSMLGAIQKLSRHEGYSFRADWDSGDMKRYNVVGAPVCAFIGWPDEFDTYTRKEL